MNNDELLKAEITKNMIEVSGYKCRELILTCKSGIQKHYFTSKLPVDPAIFKNYRWGNFHEILA
ncbi:hypothetical protein L1278_000095 [Pontibacter sp. HSC-36F09]|nr:hypothetical protein [Pontibacter sp. HSC-36F09]